MTVSKDIEKEKKSAQKQRERAKKLIVEVCKEYLHYLDKIPNLISSQG